MEKALKLRSWVWNQVSLISWKHVLPVLVLTVIAVAVPHTADAAMSNPIDKVTEYFESIQTSLVDLVRILAVIGIMICAVGLFLGNAGDGVKRLLVILIAALVASYAAEWFGSLFK